MNPLARQADLNLLLPSFRARVEVLLERMRARGFKPLVWETYRTAERAALLQKQGSSKNGVLSMHRYGAAVDIVDADKLWSNPAFFQALEEESEALGLTSGRDWDRNDATKESFVDSPHVQAVTVAQQNAFRALASDAQREAYLVKRLPAVA